MNNRLPWFLEGTRAIDSYSNPQRLVVLDVETTNLEHGSPINTDNSLVLACWYVVTPDGVEKKSKWGDEYEQEELLADIASAEFVVAHNAKFELGWLRRMGAELRDILVFDTMLAEWVLAGNRKWDLSLQGTSKKYKLGQKLSLASLMIKSGIDTPFIPKVWLEPYCYQDVELCYQLYLKQRLLLEQEGQMHIALTRNLCCACLADIEFNGCHLDKSLVRTEYDQAINAFHEVEEELTALTGGVNLSSPKQLAEYVYGTLGFSIPKDHRGNELRTGKGAPSTKAETLAMLVPTTEEQERFFAKYKIRNSLDALISKNLEFFKRVVEEYDGVFYGSLNQGFTKTHRLSSSGRPLLFKGFKTTKGAQFQNLPRIFKKLFTAHEEGWSVHEVDGSQLEFRVAAQVGEDDVAYEEIANKVDVHSITANTLTEAGEPTSRQAAKASTFAPLFAGGGKTPAQKAYAKFFKEKYHKLYDAQTLWTHEVLNTGKLELPWGMKYYWPGTKMSKYGYIDNTTQIFNAPIQGLATAEIIPIAMVYFWHLTKDLPVIIFNTIHDSVASRVRDDAIEEVMQIAKECFTTYVYRHLEQVYNYSFVVPLGVGQKVGKNWGVSKTEYSWDVFPDGRENYQVKE